jgi:hypothetical protein
MKVQVIDVFEAKDGSRAVTFKARCGTGIAQWRSERISPHVGEEFDIEFDVSATADRATNTRNTEIVSPALQVQGQVVLLQGTIESVEEDGMALLRMATDCLVMIDTVGGISIGDVVQICVPSSALSITPTGI